MISAEVKKIAKKLLAQKVKYLGETKVGKIYEPLYAENLCIGYPTFIIENGENVRMSTYDESTEIMKRFYK